MVDTFKAKGETPKQVKVTVSFLIDIEDFANQRGYLLNEHNNNPENDDIAGIVLIVDHIADKIMDENPTLEGKLL